jgi:hypothetical protein
MHSRTFLSSILLVAFLCSSALAQQVQQHANQTGWLLEVSYLKGAPPAYERVRLPGTKMSGDWYGRFGKVAGWQLPDGAQPIQAVRISNRLSLKEDKIRVRVSVLRGEKFMDAEETVATYDLLENEKIVVEDLKRFGVEPFELRAFRTEPLPTSQPTVLNKTTSIEVINVESVAADLPEYKLTLRNLSTKPIAAFRVDIVDRQRRLSSGMPQGFEGAPLMLVGATTQVRLPMVVRANATDKTYSPAEISPQQFVIKSVVFADGTDEGVTEREFETGSGFKSTRFGERVAIQRALPLFAAALESTDAISSDGADKLRAQLEALDVTIGDAELIDLTRQFPAKEPKTLKASVEFGLHFMRKQMLDQLAHFQTNSKRGEFRTWLIENQARYSQWLARLEA